MAMAFPRLLLALSAVILIAGWLMHARAFGKTLSALAASNLGAFYANSLKALWLIDSATLITLAVVFALIAARPTSHHGPWSSCWHSYPQPQPSSSTSSSATSCRPTCSSPQRSLLFSLALASDRRVLPGPPELQRPSRGHRHG